MIAKLNRIAEIRVFDEWNCSAAQKFTATKFDARELPAMRPWWRWSVAVILDENEEGKKRELACERRGWEGGATCTNGEGGVYVVVRVLNRGQQIDGWSTVRSNRWWFEHLIGEASRTRTARA